MRHAAGAATNTVVLEANIYAKSFGIKLMQLFLTSSDSTNPFEQNLS